MRMRVKICWMAMIERLTGIRMDSERLKNLLKFRRATGGCWPTPPQTLLLHAIIDPLPQAGTALQAWLKETDLDALDPGTFRLLPLLHKRYAGTPAEKQLDMRIKGVRRHAFYRSRLAASRYAPTVQALVQAGIRPMLLKGAALACGYYDDASERPMEDLDLLIEHAEVERALDTIAPFGWQPYNRAEYQVSLRDPSGFEIDLHWHLIAESWFVPGFEADLRTMEEPAIWQGMTLTKPNPSDLLFHVLVHGLKWNVIPPVRWLVDAHHILEKRGADIDWQRVLLLGERTATSEVLAETLTYAAREFALPVPATVLESLQESPRSAIARKELATRIRRPGVLGFVPLALIRHARRAPSKGFLQGWHGLAAYLSDCVGERTLPGAFSSAVRKAVRRVWRMLRGRA